MKRFLCMVCLLLPATGLAASPSPAQILARAKTASGGAAWNHIHTLRSEGSIHTSGLSGHVTEVEDLVTGRSVTHFELGPLEGAQGFDGKMGWNKAPGGEVSPADSPQGKQLTATAAYQTVQGWWFPKRWPGKIKLIGQRKAGHNTYWVLHVLPRGGLPFDMWINTQTHLIARTVMATGEGSVKETTYLSDYRTVDGVKMAFHVRISNGKKQYDTNVQLDKVEANVPVTAAEFAMPGQELKDVSFVGGGNKATIPFKLINNHIYIQVSINGHPLHFMFDTGGANILTPGAAKSAGIKSQGAMQGGGVGKKSVNTGFGKVKNLTLGGKVVVRNQIFGVLAMPGYSDVEGVPFNGLVGYEVLKRFVVQIDYAARTMTFMRAQAFNPADAGTAIPFTYLGRIPGVKGSIDGMSGEFEIDTGSRAALSMWAPFVKKHHMVSRYKTTPDTVVGWGVGGNASARVTRGGKLMIGPVSVNDPVMELSSSKEGAGADKFIAGNIGGEILKHFTVTFDYAKQLMYLKPNKTYGEPMTYDRSGMWINGAKEGFEVMAILAGGPAQQAGLKVGDIITAVNGKPAGDLTLYGLREMLRESASGTRVKLTIGNGAKAHDVSLVLRRLIPQKSGLKKAA